MKKIRFALNRNNVGVLVAFVVIMAGCQQQAPKPASTAPAEATPAVAVVEDSTPFELEAGFELLKLNQFDAFAAEGDTWKESGEILAGTGKPRGYLYSKESYSNFTWRLDFRYPRPEKLKDDSKFKGNTGFLVYITGEQKLWPVCIEIQGKNVQIAAIRENGGADAVVTEDDETARLKSRKPVGQWNSLEIVSKDGALTATLNGTTVAASQAGSLSSGLIGIQSEDHPFEVRRMRIRKE